MRKHRNGISYAPAYTALLSRTAAGYHCRIEREDSSLAGDAAGYAPQDAIAAAWGKVFPISMRTCPDNKRHEDDIVGCGRTFTAEPDNEGLIDCPHCGMWFS
jgi:hypothetical protein